MRVAFRQLLTDERGAAVLEYGAIACGIGLAALAAASTLRAELGSLFHTIQSGLHTINSGR